MRNKHYDRGYSQGDLLDGDARAVIEADFKEITTSKKPQSFVQLVKDVFQWIKQKMKSL